MLDWSGFDTAKGERGRRAITGIPPDHLARDRLDHVAERKRILLFRHAGMEHHLQQQIAEFLPEIVEVVARDGVHDLMGCLLSLIHISEPTRRTPTSYAVF